MRFLPLLLFLFVPSANGQDAWETLTRESRPSLRIESKVADGPWKSGSVSIKAGTPVKLRVPIPNRVETTEIRWYQIIPDVSQFYKNANHPWEVNAYQWVGFGKIKYDRRELESWRGQWEIGKIDNKTFTLPQAAQNYRDDLGSFWLQAEIKVGNQLKRSAGLEENTHQNLSPKVFRLTLRKDDDYLGHLTGFFNVPGLFGSVPYQSNNYIGADCADILVAARRKWRNLNDSKDYNVAMLVNAWPVVKTFEMSNGNPIGETIPWEDVVKPGDSIAVKYPGRRRYQHIGALYEDSNQNGVLDGADKVIHAGPESLHLTILRHGSFDGGVAILRPPR